MPKFTIAVTWEMAGEFEVEADTLEQAIEMVEDDDDTYAVDKADGEYVDDSFKVNKEFCEGINTTEALVKKMKESTETVNSNADFVVNTQQGSVWSFQPMNDRAKEHTREAVKPEGWQWLGDRFWTDSNAAVVLLDLLEEDGFVLEVL